MANKYKWTRDEDNIIRKYYKESCPIKYFRQYLPQRTEVAVKARAKYLKKKDNIYNEDHIKNKYEENKAFFNLLSPSTVLDLMAGKNRFWHTFIKGSEGCDCKVLDNDLGNYGTTFSRDANDLLELFLKYGSTGFDLIDLDPFGIPTKDLVINSSRLTRKGLLIGIGGFIRTKTLIKTKNPYFFEERFGIGKDIEFIDSKDLSLGVLNTINKESDHKFTLHKTVEYKNYHRLLLIRED